MEARVVSSDALTGAGLIDAAKGAQAALDAGTPPAGTSEARFIAAMIARVRELAVRDQALAPALAAQESAIVKKFGAGEDLATAVAAIRSGALDADETLYHALRRLAVLRLQATKPEAVLPEDLRKAGR
jgi:hypothetical protein